MTTQEIATRLVELCRQGQYETAQKELYADDAISIEPPGNPMSGTVQGIDAIIAKGHQFQAGVEEFHGSSVSDPIVAGNVFAATIVIDATFKGMGRMVMEEVAAYKVKYGKIVSEEFIY